MFFEASALAVLCHIAEYGGDLGRYCEPLYAVLSLHEKLQLVAPCVAEETCGALHIMPRSTVGVSSNMHCSAPSLFLKVKTTQQNSKLPLCLNLCCGFHAWLLLLGPLCCGIFWSEKIINYKTKYMTLCSCYNMHCNSQLPISQSGNTWTIALIRSGGKRQYFKGFRCS